MVSHQKCHGTIQGNQEWKQGESGPLVFLPKCIKVVFLTPSTLLSAREGEHEKEDRDTQVAETAWQHY